MYLAGMAVRTLHPWAASTFTNPTQIISMAHAQVLQQSREINIVAPEPLGCPSSLWTTGFSEWSFLLTNLFMYVWCS